MASLPVETPSLGLDRKFIQILAVVAVILAAIPTLLGYLAAPAQTTYLGYQYATDDHMVYAAWMRQAMDGRFLFDNRFTTDAQPGLTIHLYFLFLGWIAKVIGISLASNLARLAFTFWFVQILGRWVNRLGWNRESSKAAILLAVFGGGLGFLSWQLFGEAIVGTSPLAPLTRGLEPTDVWQPEGFVFPSMLTNGLFMVSLCLILLAMEAYAEAKDSPKAVEKGAIAMGLLMNIHSYDVLIVAPVAVFLAAAAFCDKQLTKSWLTRAVLITLGVALPAGWFLYVLKQDTVFQARAATETYSPNFRQLLFGYLPLILLALAGIGRMVDEANRKRVLAGVGAYSVLLIALYGMAGNSGPGYFLSDPLFFVVLLVAIGSAVGLRTENQTLNTILGWALIGTVGVYFPGLFQRKLAMGLALPWGLLAGYGLVRLLQDQTKTLKMAFGGLAAILCGLSSILWLRRELTYIQGNVSRTSVHSVFLSPDATNVINALNAEKGRRVVVAPPGIPSTLFSQGRQEIGPLNELTPVMPDLNPVASGLTGAYTIAGHWSETPKYNERRGDLSAIYYSNAPEDVKVAKLKEWGVTHVIAAVPGAFPGLPLTDFSAFGEVVADGRQFRLIRLR